MPLTTAFRNLLCQMIVGQAVTAYDNTHAYLGVGDGTTAFNAAQTDLQGTNKLRKAMDATYPQLATNVITAQATFGTGDANFHWQEVGLFNGSSGGTMMQRLVQDLGTKSSAATWVLTMTYTQAVS